MGRGLPKPEPDPSEQILRIKMLELAVATVKITTADVTTVAQQMYDWVKNNPPKSEGE